MGTPSGSSTTPPETDTHRAALERGSRAIYKSLRRTPCIIEVSVVCICRAIEGERRLGPKGVIQMKSQHYPFHILWRRGSAQTDSARSISWDGDMRRIHKTPQRRTLEVVGELIEGMRRQTACITSEHTSPGATLGVQPA